MGNTAVIIGATGAVGKEILKDTAVMQRNSFSIY